MQTTVTTTKEWALSEFGQAELGDVRRRSRLVKVASGLAGNSQGTLPDTFSRWADLKAAYRLLDNDEVTYEKVAQAHWLKTRNASQEAGEYLLIEDTTQLDFSRRADAEAFGLIGDGGGRGMFVHSTLALRVERWSDRQEPEVRIVGMLGQRVWMRPEIIGSDREKKKERLSRSRESERWAAVFREIRPMSALSRWTYVADRESDIYEVFERCRGKNVEFIIRASQPRALVREDRCAFEAVAQGPCMGRFSLDLRARPGQSARQAQVEVRVVTVTLRAPWRPGGDLGPCQVNVVEAREVDPPAGVEPIHWVLLTSWGCGTLEQAGRVVRAYARRWLIEEYHKALKSGVQVEQSQLSTPARVQALLGILSIVALRLVDAKLLAATCPEDPLAPEALGPESLAILESKWGKPKSGWTNATVIVAIARMGGFLARKGDGNPGWLTIWRGMKKLALMSEGYGLAAGEKCG